MSAPATAWMPFYVGDYLGDTQRLTTEQHGAYLLLILDYWRNGPAPDDDAVLQQITKLERSAWRKHRSALERLFQVSDGEWRHKRIDQELVSAQSNAERRSSKAKVAAQARWENAPRNASGMPQALPEECPPQSPTPLSNDNGPEENLDKDFWDAAKGYLGKNKASLIGKWCGEHGQPATAQAITAAMLKRPPDPVAYIQGIFRAQTTEREHVPLC